MVHWRLRRRHWRRPAAVGAGEYPGTAGRLGLGADYCKGFLSMVCGTLVYAPTGFSDMRALALSITKGMAYGLLGLHS